jgi:integrase
VGNVLQEYLNKIARKDSVEDAAGMLDAALSGKQYVAKERTDERISSVFYLRRFLRDETGHCNKLVKDFTRAVIKGYIKRRSEEVYEGPSSKRWKKGKLPTLAAIKREISPLSKAFNRLKDHDQTYLNPFSGCFDDEDFDDIREHSRKGRSLESGELEMMLEKCNSCMGQNLVLVPLVILIAYETGMRRKEILNLSWEDVNFAEEYIHIRHEKIDKKKRDAGLELGRKIPLTEAVKTALLVAKRRHNIGEYGKVFLDWSTKAMEQAFADVVLRAQIEIVKSGGKFDPFTFHCFRHDAARRFKDILKYHEVIWMLGHMPGKRNTQTDDYGPPNAEALDKMKRKLDLDAIGLSEDKGYTKEQYDAALLDYGKMFEGTDEQHQDRREKQSKMEMLDVVRWIVLREKTKSRMVKVSESDGMITFKRHKPVSGYVTG